MGNQSLMAHLCMCGDRGGQGPPSPMVTPASPNHLSPSLPLLLMLLPPPLLQGPP